MDFIYLKQVIGITHRFQAGNNKKARYNDLAHIQFTAI